MTITILMFLDTQLLCLLLKLHYAILDRGQRCFSCSNRRQHWAETVWGNDRSYLFGSSGNWWVILSRV